MEKVVWPSELGGSDRLRFASIGAQPRKTPVMAMRTTSHRACSFPNHVPRHVDRSEQRLA